MGDRNLRLIVFGLCVGIGLNLHTLAVAATHNVPGDFATVAAALTVSSPGDTVLVAAGVYSPTSNGETFPLNLNVDSLYLLGAGMDLSIIDAEQSASVLLCNGAVGSRVAGFTITGGRADRGAGIWVWPDECGGNWVSRDQSTERRSR